MVDAWGDMLKIGGLTLKILGGAKKEDLYDEFDKKVETVFVPALKYLENQLAEDGGPYLAGDKLTIGDCCFVAMLANLFENPAGPWAERFKPVLAQYPKVQAYHLALREAFKERLGDPTRTPKPM